MNFLHRADIITGEAQWVRTNVDQLRKAIFLDGREQFWTSASVESCAFARSPEPTSPHFLFHFGFCGSTLLAKMLDRPGALLVLKEPQSLTDIASQKPVLDSQWRRSDLTAGLEHTLTWLACLTTREPVLVKPSSWINGLLPLLSRAKSSKRAIFLSIDQRDYLRATFRGGRDRLAHCSQFASLIADELVDGQHVLQQAIASSNEPLDKVAHIMAFIHAGQTALFDDAIRHGNWQQSHRVDYGDIARDPLAVVRQSVEALGIDQSEWAEQRIPSGHAKDESREFSYAEFAAQNEEIENHHSVRFDAAMQWIETVELSVRAPS